MLPARRITGNRMVNFGTALAGIGGAMPQIQEQVDKASAVQALQRYAAQGQGAGIRPVYPPAAPPGMTTPPAVAPQGVGAPGGPVNLTPMPSPGQAPMPAPRVQAPQIPSPPPAPPPQDMMAQQIGMIDKIMSGPGSPGGKLEALKTIGAFVSPMEKMQSQFEMNLLKMQNSQQLLQQRLEEMRDLQMLRNQQSGANAGTRANTASGQQTAADLRSDLAAAQRLVSSYVSMGDTSSQGYKDALADYQDTKKALKAAVEGAAPAAGKTGDAGGAGQAAPSAPDNSPSQADLEFTAKKYGITVDEVKKRLQGQ